MLGDGLTSQPGTLSQLGDGARLPAAKPGDQREPRLIAQGGIGNPATRDLAGHEWTIQFGSKPLTEFPVVRESLPDAGDGSFEFDAFFDSVFHCLCNLRVAC